MRITNLSEPNANTARFSVDHDIGTFDVSVYRGWIRVGDAGEFEFRGTPYSVSRGYYIEGPPLSIRPSQPDEKAVRHRVTGNRYGDFVAKTHQEKISKVLEEIALTVVQKFGPEIMRCEVNNAKADLKDAQARMKDTMLRVAKATGAIGEAAAEYKRTKATDYLSFLAASNRLHERLIVADKLLTGKED